MRSSCDDPVQVVSASWFQSKVAIVTTPSPAVRSTIRGCLPSAIHTVPDAVPVATSSPCRPAREAGADSIVAPVTAMGTIASGRPASVLCHVPPVPRSSEPPART